MYRQAGTGNAPHAFHFIIAAIVTIAASGCHSPTPSEALIGHWQGTQQTGNVRVPAAWEFRPDGTETIALLLPQGSLVSEGSWTLQSGTLFLRTTGRVLAVNGQKKHIPLTNPLTMSFGCVPAGDKLTVTDSIAHQTFTLTRNASSLQASPSD